MQTRSIKHLAFWATPIVFVLLLLFFCSDWTSVAFAQPCGGNITPKEWINGYVNVGQQCRYTFYGYNGDVVSIAMVKETGTIDPWLDLTDPDGYIVASDDDSYGNHDSLIRYRLLRTGRYTIVAGSYNGAGSGSYWVFLEK